MTEPSNLVSLPSLGNQKWIESYQQACLSKRNDATIDAYVRILRQFTEWATKRPGHKKHFLPEYLPTTVAEGYLTFLKDQGYSVSHRQRVKSVINQLCQWLIDEKEILNVIPCVA